MPGKGSDYICKVVEKVGWGQITEGLKAIGEVCTGDSKNTNRTADCACWVLYILETLPVHPSAVSAQRPPQAGEAG